jgi:nucleotide-binding universal stress UspA family protein
MPKPVIAAIDPVHQDIAPAALGAMLARLLREPLQVVTTYPIDLGIDNLIPDYAETLEREAQRAVNKVAGELERGMRDPIALTARVVEAPSSPAAALHEVAEREGASVLVIGSSRRGSARRVLPSAVTDRLLHGAPCPVAVAPVGLSIDDALRAPRVIAVAVTDTDDGRAALAAADALVGAAHARARVLAVGEPMPELMAGTLTPAEQALARQGLDKAAKTTLDHALAAIKHKEGAEAKLLSGSVADALAEAASKHDLLVCGSRGHGPLRTLVLGSVSHELVRKARCPILVVPRGTTIAVATDAAPEAA